MALFTRQNPPVKRVFIYPPKGGGIPPGEFTLLCAPPIVDEPRGMLPPLLPGEGFFLPPILPNYSCNFCFVVLYDFYCLDGAPGHGRPTDPRPTHPPLSRRRTPCRSFPRAHVARANPPLGTRPPSTQLPHPARARAPPLPSLTAHRINRPTLVPRNPPAIRATARSCPLCPRRKRSAPATLTVAETPQCSVPSRIT